MTSEIGIDVEDTTAAWKVELYGPERTQLEAHYRNIEETERSKIFFTAAAILGQCPNPATGGGRQAGLALGKVQSGKTASFIALTALAFDNGYRIVIVLAGTKKNLLDQNHRRLKSQLGLESRTDRRLAAFSTINNIEEVRYQDVLGLLEKGTNILVTILKHPDHLKHLKAIFNSTELRHYPTLIIDDEGDQASLNTQIRKRGKSPTYEQIVELRKAFTIHAYVAFTATPQANLLIKTIDDLAPEFCVRIEPGRGYTGGSTFHGKDKSKYIRDIPESETPIEEMEGVPDSLSQALAAFLVGAAVRSIRGDLDHHSMLVHTSHKKNHHKLVGDRVQALFESWKQRMLLSDADPARGGVLKELKRGYEEVCPSPDKFPTWKDIAAQIRTEVKDHRIWIVNSSDFGEIPTPENIHFKNNIFIGGNMLDRGVTLPGLAITYITRHAKDSQADTVEQRARWFGYKQSYLDLCRVFAPVGVSKNFSDLLGHEDDLWASLEQIELDGLPVKFWKSRLFKLAPQFKPTRPSVATAKEFNYEGWTIQNRPQTDPEPASANATSAKEFFNSVATTNKQFGPLAHRFALRCTPDVVVDTLLRRLQQPSDGDWDDEHVRLFFNRLKKTGKFHDMDVVSMTSNGHARERELTETGRIKNLMQGHSPRMADSDPRYYVGDREIHQGRVQLQVHLLTLHDKTKTIYPPETVALALYVPPELISELGRLIIGDE